MKRHFILGIMAVAALASCNKSEVLNQESLNEKGITFSAYAGKATQTKAVSIYQDSLKNAGIGILAWRTGTEDVTSDILSTTDPSFMPNIQLTWAKGADDNYTGTYSPERYWPSTGAKVSFFAYAPYSKGDGTAPTGQAAKFHPENITIPLDNGKPDVGANKLTLTVPDTEFDKHTDFMVARKGNGENNSGTTAQTTVQVPNPAYDPNDPSKGPQNIDQTVPGIFVGINQNLTKEYDGAVQLQMTHALSRISFQAKATGTKKNADGTSVDVPQNTPYSDGFVKVVLNDIKLEGSFTKVGTYDLFEEKWTIEPGNTTNNGYTLTNTSSDDPFNPIADEWYNIQAGTDDATEANTPDAQGWYNLNKSTHDLMLIPFTATETKAKITNVVGSYTVKTYKHATMDVTVDDGQGGSTTEKVLAYVDPTDPTGQTKIPDAETNGTPNKPWLEEIPEYQDVVWFGKKQDATGAWVDDPFDEAIELLPGKHYKFRFNIHLKKIEFSVSVDEWEAADEIITDIVK